MGLNKESVSVDENSEASRGRYVENIKLDLLDFDPLNPRFPKEINQGTSDVIVEVMAKEERVLELMKSIGEQGYFPGEPLLVVGPTLAGRYFVVEGNRRLAALKLLKGLISVPSKLITLQQAKEEVKIPVEDEVPCIVFKAESEVLRYLGFRHITGVKPWKSLAKARYLKRLREEFYANVDPDALLKSLAKEIGSRADYVGQMLSSLAVLEFCEEHNFFDIQRIDPNRIEFSLLTTALSYSNIYKFIGLNGLKDIDARSINGDRVREIFTWIYAQQDGNKTVLGDSRNLEMLAKVVDDQVALEELRTSGDLDSAYRLTSGELDALTSTLIDIEKMVEKALKLTIRPLSFTEEQRGLARSIFNQVRKMQRTIEDPAD